MLHQVIFFETDWAFTLLLTSAVPADFGYAMLQDGMYAHRICHKSHVVIHNVQSFTFVSSSFQKLR